MNRFACIVKRCNRVLGTLTADSSHIGRIAPSICPAVSSITKVGRYSTTASELKDALPKFWISKMKTAFAWLDVDGDGYLTENDFAIWEEEMTKLCPDMSEEQRDILASNKRAVWNDLFGGRGKGADYKITEDMYIERLYYVTTLEGSEEMLRKEWERNFSVMDINKDGVISKTEHGLFFRSWKDPIGGIVAFTAIDENMDGVISREEYTKAGTEFLFNFTDESKRSKYMFGPLKF